MRLIPFVILSVLIHIAVSAMMAYLPQLAGDPEVEPPQLIEVVLYDPSKAETIIPDLGAVDEKVEDEEKAKLKSRRKVRVKNQMQAYDLGQSRNQNLAGPRRSAQKEKVQSGRKRLVEMIKNDLGAPVRQEQNFGKSGLPHSARSTFTTRLPGIQNGQLTLLNTEATDIKFYSYFARIHPQVRGHWEGFVEQAVNEQLEMRGTTRSWKAWSTIVEIVLDKEGNHVRSFLHRESGLAPLDIAAIDGLEATSFLNPPEELLDEDKLVRLYYHLTVEAPGTLAERHKN